jgi:DNA-binding GntR family transcriptional regulator
LRKARERVKDADLRELESMADQIVEAFRKGDLSAQARADEVFHLKIAELSGNRWLFAALHRILVSYFAFELRTDSHQPRSSEQTVRAQHEAYLNYLSRIDARSVEECVEFHLHPNQA